MMNLRSDVRDPLAPTEEGIRQLVTMTSAAGRKRGREESRRELQGLVELSAASAIRYDGPSPHWADRGERPDSGVSKAEG